MRRKKLKREKPIDTSRMRLKYNPRHDCPQCGKFTSVIAGRNKGFWCPHCQENVDSLADALDFYKKNGEPKWMKSTSATKKRKKATK